MEGSAPRDVGRIAEIWRYPVKSMLGEQIASAEVTARGVAGDRAFALIDRETGKVASAKNPRRWPSLFGFRAAFFQPQGDARTTMAAKITFPDGSEVTTDAPDVESRLSAAVGRPILLARSAPEHATAEGYWPDHDWLAQRDETFEFPLPSGTFFDGALVHLVTTATLDQLGRAEPASRFDVRRFRPNFVVEPATGSAGYVEDASIGQTLAIGQALLRIDGPCPRCIMTTLAQGDLPRDPLVLKTAVQQNGGNVGVYASVIRAGRVAVGDPVRIV